MTSRSEPGDDPRRKLRNPDRPDKGPDRSTVDFLPWTILERHRQTAIMNRFQTIADLRAGIDIGQDAEQLLIEWLDELHEHDVVVNYLPDAPPNSASKMGGFYYVPRQSTDVWIVRDPDTA